MHCPNIACSDLCVHNLSILRCFLFSVSYGQWHFIIDNNILEVICFDTLF